MILQRGNRVRLGCFLQAALAALLFLVSNGVPDESLPSEEPLERLTLSVAEGNRTKEEITEWFRGYLPDVEP